MFTITGFCYHEKIQLSLNVIKTGINDVCHCWLSRCLLIGCFVSLGVSEDSDYTSDVNFPVHSHHHNSSARQYMPSIRRQNRPPMQKQRSTLSPYYASMEKSEPSFEMSNEEGSFETPYPREYETIHETLDRYDRHDQEEIHRRTSNASEPLFYNSRPNDRLVTTTNHQRQHNPNHLAVSSIPRQRARFSRR